MIRSLLTLTLLAVSTLSLAAQEPEGKYTVFTGKGQPSSVDEIMKSLAGVDVVFLGEFHDDPIAHAIQLEIFKRAIEQYGVKRKVTLSLEMFERDVQTVLNEYLAGQISESHFLLSSRPWPRYKEDYRPLVELAKEKKLQVIAANAPRRYVNMVSRNGRTAVNGLSPLAKTWLAPLPYAEASETYSKKFKSLMGSSAEASMGLDKILSSQSLWDATMAHSVAESLRKNKGSLVVHLNGGFHTEMRLGTVEHFLKYRKNGKAIVVTMRYEDDFKKFDAAKHTDAGDFVILTQRPPRQGGVIRDVLRRMGENAKSIKSLTSDLKMIRYNSQLKEADESTGNLTFLTKASRSLSNARINWTHPMTEQMTVANGRFILYRPRLSQAVIGQLSGSGDAVSRLMSFVDMSGTQLKANFDIIYQGEQTVPDNVKTFHLKLAPKAKELFKSFEIWVDVDGQTRQVLATDEKNDTIALRFSGIQKNQMVPGDVFTIRPPRGTKIIQG